MPEHDFSGSTIVAAAQAVSFKQVWYSPPFRATNARQDKVPKIGDAGQGVPERALKH